MLATKSVNLSSYRQRHVTLDGFTVYIELESIFWRILEIPCLRICPFSEELSWSFAPEAIIIRNKAQEWENCRKLKWAKTRIIANITNSRWAGIIGAPTVALGRRWNGSEGKL